MTSTSQPTASEGDRDGRRDGEKAPLARRTAEGIAWSLAQSVVGRISLLVSQLVLARILLPSDFGLVGLATTIATFCTTLVYFGIDQILQQRGTRARFWATQVFWISLGCGSVGGLITAIAGMIGAHFYREPQLIPLSAVIAITTPLIVLSTVPAAALQWQLRFGFIARYNAAEAVLTQLLIVVFALAGLGALSFVIPVAIMAAVKAVIFWRAAKVKLRPFGRSKGWLKVAGRGVTAFVTRVSQVIVAQGDFLILGIFATTSVVGAYFFAFRLVAQPMNMLGGSVSSVLFSSLLKINEPRRRAEVAFEAASFVGAITIPVCFLVGVLAKPAVPLVFGAKWLPSISLIQLVSMGLPFDAICWSAGAYLTAQGQFNRILRYQVLMLPFFIVATSLGAWRWSAEGVAIAVSLYYFFHSMLFSALTFRATHLGCWPVMLLFGRLLVAAGASFGGAYYLCYQLIPGAHPIAQMIFMGLLGCGAYALAMFLIARALFDRVATRVLGVLRPRGSGRAVTPV